MSFQTHTDVMCYNERSLAVLSTRTMDADHISPGKWKLDFVYLYDIVKVFGSSGKLIDHVQLVLALESFAVETPKLRKCEFFTNAIDYHACTNKIVPLVDQFS